LFVANLTDEKSSRHSQSSLNCNKIETKPVSLLQFYQSFNAFC